MRWLSLLCLFAFFFSCQQEERLEPLHLPALMETPAGFPNVDFPTDNAFTKERWNLGKKLFFDPILSVDSSISCASCHHPELAFSDEVDFSIGAENQLGTRNAPSLANVAYHPYFTREGGVPTLEMQVLVPIQEHNEFNFNILLIAERLSKQTSYVNESMQAYQRPPDPFVITRSLACFERSLLSGNSPYDQFVNQEKKNVLTAAEQNGMALFFSERTNCSQCHNDFNFTNYAFENNGLYEEYADLGRFRLTREESDKALFKVPSLRNIALTGPYMHNGSIQTLEEVIEHYNSGGKNHPNKSALIKALKLSETEQTELLLFLKTLTDQSFIENPLFQQ